jgi:hypothetical protein
MPPRVTAYEYTLDDHGRNWIRVRFVKDRGQILDFTVQYETTIQGKRTPVVRYDTHHDFAHRDTLFLDGSQVKEPLPNDGSMNAALQFAIRDKLSSWRHYRDRFLRGRP